MAWWWEVLLRLEALPEGALYVPGPQKAVWAGLSVHLVLPALTARVDSPNHDNIGSVREYDTNHARIRVYGTLRQ